MKLPTGNDVKERLSLAYVRAVAARCGCYVTATEGADLAGIDCTLHTALHPDRMISIQLKSTAQAIPKDIPIPFDLDVETYNKLRYDKPTAPQLLVLLALPKNSTQWINSNSARLIFKRAAWWVDLWGQPDPATNTTKRVFFDQQRIFGVDSLMQILAAASKVAEGTVARKPLHEL